MQPNSPFLTRARAEAWRAAPPSVAPADRPRPADSRTYRLAILALRLLVMLLVVVLAFWAFILFGEERSREPLRPALTARQRAQAFRNPRHD